MIADEARTDEKQREDEGFFHRVAQRQRRFRARIAANSTLDLVYRINEGPQILIEHILVVGNAGVESGTIRRELALEEGQPLGLADVELSVANIISMEAYDERLAVSFIAGGMTDAATFRVYKVPAKDLKREVDVVRSATWAEMTREKMVQEGRGGSFRTTICRQCTATLDVSDMPETPQVYCHFCDSLTTSGPGGMPDEHEFGLCEECGMFSKPKRFTIFYFYFLVFVWGYSSRVTHRCPACMRTSACARCPRARARHSPLAGQKA